MMKAGRVVTDLRPALILFAIAAEPYAKRERRAAETRPWK
jgi:hypothetical protein